MNLKPIKNARGFKTRSQFECSSADCAQTFVFDRRRVGKVVCPVCQVVQRIPRGARS